MVLVIVRVQLLPFDGDLSDGSILFDVFRIPVPNIHGQVAEFSRDLKLKFLAEERRQCSLDDRRSADFLLVEGHRAIDVPEGAWR